MGLRSIAGLNITRREKRLNFPDVIPLVLRAHGHEARGRTYFYRSAMTGLLVCIPTASPHKFVL